jgi:hypothetical protein
MRLRTQVLGLGTGQCPNQIRFEGVQLLIGLGDLPVLDQKRRLGSNGLCAHRRPVRTTLVRERLFRFRWVAVNLVCFKLACR